MISIRNRGNLVRTVRARHAIVAVSEGDSCAMGEKVMGMGFCDVVEITFRGTWCASGVCPGHVRCPPGTRGCGFMPGESLFPPSFSPLATGYGISNPRKLNPSPPRPCGGHRDVWALNADPDATATATTTRAVVRVSWRP